MKRKKAIFIVEITVLFASLIMVISVVSMILVMCRNISTKAARLNDAVILAAGAAETASAAGDPDDLADAMRSMVNNEDGICRILTDEAEGTAAVWMIASVRPEDASSHRYIVKVSRLYRSGNVARCCFADDFADDIIDVFDAGDIEDVNDPGVSGLSEPLYSLKTGCCLDSAGREAGA